MQEKIKFEKTIIKIGESSAITIPTEILNYLEIKIGDTLIIQPDNGKHGKFISFWKKQ